MIYVFKYYELSCDVIFLDREKWLWGSKMGM